MKTPVPKIAAIHDLSGYGRASLTVIIPILSTMGIQVCPVPTAVLSTHTGGFSDFQFVDLSEHMKKCIDHWKNLALEFEAVYSGFLGSSEQIEIVSGFIDDFSRNNPLVVIDPVMGDDGKAYGTITENHIDEMRNLIQKADIITPNFTEASFLLKRDYDPKLADKKLRDWLLALSDKGPATIIITSVPGVNKRTSRVIAYNRNDKRFWKVDCTYIPVYYPGTGDSFASVVLGSLLQGDSLPIALDRAVQFVSIAIRASYGYDLPKREGVLLEKVLSNLNAPLTSISYEIMDW